MTRDEIYREVTTLIQQARNGHKTENQKFDFKRQWYNLKSEEGINQFLRHVCAIANTFGPDGLMVIGYDEDKDQLHNSLFTDSGLRDLSDLTNLIASRVDRLFSFSVIPMEFEGANLSIIHIPPSFDKPHLILNYQTFAKDGKSRSEKERIFVRKNTDSLIAARHDIELMYYDRKNIIPEYEVLAYYNPDFCTFRITSPNYRIILSVTFTIENIGRRPIAIYDLEFGVGEYEDEVYKLWCADYARENIIIPPGQIWTGLITFSSYADFEHPMAFDMMKGKLNSFNKNRRGLIYSDLSIKLVTGNKIVAKLDQYR
jgi:hypothetical protein